MSDINRTLVRRLQNVLRIRFYENSFFSRSYRGLKFCRHLTDFRCFCSNLLKSTQFTKFDKKGHI